MKVFAASILILINFYVYASSYQELEIKKYFEQVVSLTQTGKHEAALAICDKIIKLDPSIGRKAIEIFDELIRVNPKEVELYLNKGHILYELEKYQDALLLYNKVIELDSNRRGVYFTKGFILSQLKQHEAAVKSYNLAIKQDPQNVANYLNKGFVLFNQGKNEEALGVFDEAIAIDS